MDLADDGALAVEAVVVEVVVVMAALLLLLLLLNRGRRRAGGDGAELLLLLLHGKAEGMMARFCYTVVDAESVLAVLDVT